MKKCTLFFAALLLSAASASAQIVIPIIMARAQPVGSTVTIRGNLLNDASKMGWTYYIQDESGGIAGYSTVFSDKGVKPGDILTVTGTLKNYNSLLEISPVQSVTIVSSNNALPEPTVLTINEIITGTGGEDNESTLIKVNNVQFAATDQGKPFAAGSSGFNYNITDAAGKTMQIRILPLTDINNTLIPVGKVNITGCLGQYSPSTPNAGYQLTPRSLADIVVNSSIKLTSPVTVIDATNASLTLNWTTDTPGSTFIKYGRTKNLELGIFNGAGNLTNHSVTIPGTASEMFYAKAYSVSNAVITDTAKSIIAAYITASNSTGSMKIYFNTPVDNSVSSGTNAIYVNQGIDDTLINYINRAKQSIDIAIYNLNNDGITNISTAINAAAGRGVNVRLIYCGTTANLGIPQLNSNVHLLKAPEKSGRNGIMHNKFMIIDANSSNANDPLLWTGSMNWTKENINLDANNVIIIQDQSLAKTYQVEFEEMWGSNALIANTTNAKFGSQKTDNTPHQIKIAGKWLDCYFSPSDNVNVEIIERIRSANTDMEAAVMLITRKEMAYAISDVAKAGAAVRFLVDNFNDQIVPANPPTYPNPDSTVYNTLKKSCAQYGDYNGGGIMHNKYLIVDPGNSTSDPVVWTGSHNWSASGNNDNDENSIVIHDAAIANIYHQNFVKIIKSANVFVSLDESIGFEKNDMLVYPNPANNYVNVNVKSAKAVLFKVQMFDLSGRMIKESIKESSIGFTHVTIDLSGVKPGLYLIKVLGQKGFYSQKLIVK